jgi:hypothetical protein
MDQLEQRLRERLLQEEDVVVAYLFGSQARGTAGPLSDVDVAVLLPVEADVGRRQLELIAAVADVVGLDSAEVVVLNNAPATLGYRVLRDGHLLLSRDDRARVRHYVRTVDRYLDMGPMRRTLEAGTRHQLAEAALVDPEVVRRRIRDIAERVSKLAEIRAFGRERFLTDEMVRAAAERLVQLAVQSAIDIAVHVIAEDSGKTPEEYGAAFLALAERGVIDAGLAERLRSAAGMRNVLVHEYLDVDRSRVWEVVEHPDDLVAFCAAVERYLG